MALRLTTGTGAACALPQPTRRNLSLGHTVTVCNHRLTALPLLAAAAGASAAWAATAALVQTWLGPTGGRLLQFDWQAFAHFALIGWHSMGLGVLWGLRGAGEAQLRGRAAWLPALVGIRSAVRVCIALSLELRPAHR